MKKAIIILTVFLAGCHSGDSPTAACPDKNSYKSFAWVTDIIASWGNCVCSPAFVEGTYKQQTVYFVDYYGPSCESTGPLTLYDCKGKVVKTFDATVKADMDDRKANLAYGVIVYECKS